MERRRPPSNRRARRRARQSSPALCAGLPCANEMCGRGGGRNINLTRREHFAVAASAATKILFAPVPRAQRGARLVSAPPRARRIRRGRRFARFFNAGRRRKRREFGLIATSTTSPPPLSANPRQGMFRSRETRWPVAPRGGSVRCAEDGGCGRWGARSPSSRPWPSGWRLLRRG